MESQSTSINTLIAQAKQAVLDGNAALARELAEQVLAADPENIAAMLLMAGLSEPAAERDMAEESARPGPPKPNRA